MLVANLPGDVVEVLSEREILATLDENGTFEKLPFMPEMLDFCGKHNITSDVEVIPIQKVNEAYERLLKSDVKYRFSMDLASLKSE